jgi:lipopolysaccharide transport system ATP-binding protein
MGTPAIRVDNLSKLYRLGGGARASLLKEALKDGLRSRFLRLKTPRAGGTAAAAEEESRELWALRDVSFEVQHGEVVGILGHNGAGKSVLLKILSRITAPTRGSAQLFGRVASLLEIGTGFHPELSGGENIYLNGAILGMTRREIQGKFDEIVEFAGVGRFLETPVKHYSSGMALRLAFSVAAHLEADLIFLDEVWGAGDADFRKRSVKKMHELIGGGRTVLIVSHSLEQLESLCKRVILLNHGRVLMDDETSKVLRYYSSIDARLDAPSAPIASV